MKLFIIFILIFLIEILVLEVPGATLDDTFPISPSSSSGSSSISTITSGSRTPTNVTNSGFGIQTPPVSRVGTPIPSDIEIPPMPAGPSNWD